MKTIQHKFVEFIPSLIEDGILYISVMYKTVVHLCACGCGNKVVTPLSPTYWAFTFDGKSISLSPSIGNWSYECQSHYWIKKNQIRFVKKWNDWEIEEGSARDTKQKENSFKKRKKKR
ncbi:MAG: hypothetical protein HOO86_13510 [Bacteroidales bacterium]|nr:hypothetical protein [Bacteroidales bacterium]